MGQTLFGFHPPSYSLLRLPAVTMQLMGGIDPLYIGSGTPIIMKTEDTGLQCGFTQDDICKGLDYLVWSSRKTAEIFPSSGAFANRGEQ